jgi:predicted MFS family arabinose efflux permease
MAAIDTRRGRIVLTLAHVAGMIDMVALPLWIGTLMEHYGYSAPQAGVTVTVFLVAVAVASLWLAPRFRRLPHWAHASAGFALALLAFLLAALQPVAAAGLAAMMALHAVAGLGVGGALSLTHGQIGRSENPHRLFATVNIALGMFAIVFLASVPHLIAGFGPKALFTVFAVTMGVATAVTLFAFPHDRAPIKVDATLPAPLPGAVYLVIATVVCLTLNQAMVFAFVERVGVGRGFGADRVNGVLIATGLVNLIPGALAMVLQKKCSPLTVGMLGPIVQAGLAVVLSSALTFMPYAVASALYVSTVIFTHTFAFGLLTRLDPSGRTVAATPAMMMLGSCTGPAIGGLLVHVLGYPGLGWVACATSTVAVLCMLLARLQLRRRGPDWRLAGAEMAP